MELCGGLIANKLKNLISPTIVGNRVLKIHFVRFHRLEAGAQMLVIHLHRMLFRWAGAIHAIHLMWGEDVLFLRVREKSLHHMRWIILW